METAAIAGLFTVLGAFLVALANWAQARGQRDFDQKRFVAEIQAQQRRERRSFLMERMERLSVVNTDINVPPLPFDQTWELENEFHKIAAMTYSECLVTGDEVLTEIAKTRMEPLLTVPNIDPASRKLLRDSVRDALSRLAILIKES